MLRPARPDRYPQDDTSKMKGVVVERRNCHRDLRPSCVEVGLRLDCPNDIGLMQSVEDGIYVISEVLIRPADPTRDIEFTFESICPHAETLQKTEDGRDPTSDFRLKPNIG